MRQLKLLDRTWTALMTDEQRRRIVERLNGADQVDAFEAAKTIWEDAGHSVEAGGTADKRLERPLITTLKKGRRVFNRAAAAFAMQMVTTRGTILALESAVKNKSEHPRVRGEAAEALAHAHRRKSHDVLLAGLNDSSKDVRFWSAFSLGQMAEKRAIAALQHLMISDKRGVKGFHSVAVEAAEALENIQKANANHARKHGCIFCIRGLA